MTCLDPDELIETGKRTLAAEQAILTGELQKSLTVRNFATTIFSRQHFCGIHLAGQVHLGPDAQFGRCLGVITEHPELRSELGNLLADKSKKAGLRAIGLLAYQEAGMPDMTVYKVSLRSIGDEDTTVISSAFGGGGHKNASSFLLPIVAFKDKWVVPSE